MYIQLLLIGDFNGSRSNMARKWFCGKWFHTIWVIRYDSDFQTEAPKVAKWCAQRLGYPITAVEMQDTQFYACLEESISEYSAQVNQFNIRDNLLNIKGQSTSSNFTHKRVKINFI